MSREARIVIELEGGEKYTAELGRMQRATDEFGRGSQTSGRQVDSFGRQVNDSAGSVQRMGRESREAQDDVSGLGRTSRTAGDDVARMGRDASRAGDGVGHVGDRGRDASVDMLHLGRSLAGLAATFGVIEAGKYVFNTTREFQSLHAALVTATGSSDAADTAFGWIKQFAKDTPYSLQEVTTAFIRMQNLGLDPSAHSLESFGNTASAMNKTLMDYVEAVADAITGEFERLKEFGIKTRAQGDQVAFTFRGVTTTVANNSAAIQQYLTDLGDTQFAGGMQRQMQTLTGATSNFGDALAQLANDATNKSGLDHLFDGAVRGSTELLTDLDSVINKYGTLRSLSSLLSSGGVLQIRAHAQAIQQDASGTEGEIDVVRSKIDALQRETDRLRNQRDPLGNYSAGIATAIKANETELTQLEGQLKRLQSLGDWGKYVPQLRQQDNRPLIYPRDTPLVARDAGADPTQDNPSLKPSKQGDKRIQQLRQIVALEGRQTELAKVNVQIESGALGTLLPKQASQLRLLARRADAQKAAADSQRTAQTQAIQAAAQAATADRAQLQRIRSEVQQRRQALAMIGQKTELERTNAQIAVGAYGQINTAQANHLRQLAAEIDAQTQRQTLTQQFAELQKTVAADGQTAVGVEMARYQEQLSQLDAAQQAGIRAITSYDQVRAQIEANHSQRLTDIKQTAAGSRDTVISDLDAIRQASNNVGRSLEDAFVQAARTGKLSMKDMASSIIADLTRIAVQQSITRPLFGSIAGGGGSGGGLLGKIGNLIGTGITYYRGGGASGVATSLADAGISGLSNGSGYGLGNGGLFGTGHAGAIIGVAATGSKRVDPRVFEGAPKHHTGTGNLGHDEVPFIGKRGEGVFTADQMANLAPVGAGGGVIINNYNAPGEPETKQRTDDQGNTVIDLIWPEVRKRLMADDNNNGPVSRNRQQVYPALQRGGVQR